MKKKKKCGDQNLSKDTILVTDSPTRIIVKKVREMVEPQKGNRSQTRPGIITIKRGKKDIMSGLEMGSFNLIFLSLKNFSDGLNLSKDKILEIGSPTEIIFYKIREIVRPQKVNRSQIRPGTATIKRGKKN